MSTRRNHGDGSGWIIAVVTCFGLYSCLHEEPDKTEAQRTAMRGNAEPSAFQHATAVFTIGRSFDEDAARESALGELSGMSYHDERGYLSCTDDCSGHEAGWIAARDNDEVCGSGDSGSYDAGCNAFREAVYTRVTRAREAFDKGDDAFVED